MRTGWAPCPIAGMLLLAAVALLLALSAPACGGSSYMDSDPLAPIPTEVDEDEIIPPPLTPVWQTRSIDDQGVVRIPLFRPAVGVEQVVFAYPDQIHAMRVLDGALSWQVELSAIAAPVVHRGELIVATEGAIWWLSVEDGSFLGQSRMSHAPTVIAAAGEAVVFIDGAALYQVDKNEQGWVTEAVGATALVTSAAGDTAYVSTDNGVLIAVDTATGRERWRYVSDREARLSAAAVSTDIVYVAGNDQYLTAIDARTGSRKWRRILGVDAYGAPAVVGDIVYVAPLDSMLHGYHARNGSQLYGLPLSARTYVDLAAYDPWVVVGPRYGPWLRARAPSVYTERATLISDTAARGSGLRISPGVGPAGVALVSGDGTLVLLRPQEQR